MLKRAMAGDTDAIEEEEDVEEPIELVEPAEEEEIELLALFELTDKRDVHRQTK